LDVQGRINQITFDKGAAPSTPEERATQARIDAIEARHSVSCKSLSPVFIILGISYISVPSRQGSNHQPGHIPTAQQFVFFPRWF
jgi:hypothetical protein